ncbi:MAG: Glycosyl transferase, family 39 [Candidatus Moranbacteria bacterium GW2011_GWE1_35_17]|nr:MAG: Glycosyl transferase, family 39 [Candidatus Moranbacteria bacterium GW2011_GWE1_35_17]KKP84543.1 MAG: Glycosyl transferase, family 39 [Candidatus Moranbacteria bacterium GW2011_GWF1_35_5]
MKTRLKQFKNFLKEKHNIIIIIVSVIFLSISILNANNDAATFDEIAHIPAGYSYLTQHEMRLNPEHPPLIKNLSAFPLLFLDLNFDTSLPFWSGELPRKWDEGQWAAGRHLIWEAGNNPDQIVFWSRVPIVIISLLLGLFIFKWTKKIAGTLAGLLAFILYSFDPNVLGHNHYVTTDIGIMAFLTFSFYYFLKFIKNPTWKNVSIGGFFLGLLHLAKFSSILTLPIFGLILIGYPLIKKLKHEEGRAKTWFAYFGKGLIAFAISLLMIWVVYFFNTFNTSKETMAQLIDFNAPQTDQNIKNVYTRKVLHSLNNSVITRPLAEYGIGVNYVFRRVAGGNGAYFIGEVSDNAFTAYFPTVFLLKETIPLILLIILTSFYTFYQIFSAIKFRSKTVIKDSWHHFLTWLRHGVVQYTLFGFIILYSYLSITGNLNIGLRHLFPIFPFIYILVAKKVHDFFKSFESHKLLFAKYILALLLIWVIIEPIANYPYYLSYFNQLAGGPKNGYNYVTDSNADWGQDLKRFKIFMNKHPEIDKIRLNYFGGGNPEYYLGDKFINWWDSKRPIEAGWYAVSVNQSQGSIYDTRKNPDGTPRKPDEESWRWITAYTPVYQVGTSILIYYVPEK